MPAGRRKPGPARSTSRGARPSALREKRRGRGRVGNHAAAPLGEPGNWREAWGPSRARCMALTSYAIALGSNRRGRHGGPADTVRAAAQALDAERLSSIHATPALGPAGRGLAHAAAIVETDLEPPDLDRKSVGWGKSVDRRVVLGGSRV